MTCMICGCTDATACVDPATEEACMWLEFAPGVIELNGQGVCSFCAVANDDVMLLIASSVHEAIVQGLRRGFIAPPEPPPLIALATDADVDAVLRARRAGA